MQVEEDKTSLNIKMQNRPNRNLLPLNLTKIIKNENKLYFHPLNNKTRRSPKSGIKTPNGNKMRKPGKTL